MAGPSGEECKTCYFSDNKGPRDTWDYVCHHTANVHNSCIGQDWWCEQYSKNPVPPQIARKKRPVLSEVLDETAGNMIVEALNDNAGNKTAASKQLGMSRAGLIYALRRLGLDQHVNKPNGATEIEKGEADQAPDIDLEDSLFDFSEVGTPQD